MFRIFCPVYGRVQRVVSAAAVSERDRTVAVVFKTEQPEVLLRTYGDCVPLSLSFVHRNRLFDGPGGNFDPNVVQEYSDCP